MTHDELVDLAHGWVLKNTTCGVAFKELRSAFIETPDVIGFGGSGHSVLVECKVSRSDFLRDQKKMFRQFPYMGVGSRRFYCCPKGLITEDELPDGWGLIYESKGKLRCVFKPYKGNIGERNGTPEKNLLAEHMMMYSVLRRNFQKPPQ